MPRLPLVWGQALDRATGALRADGASFLDLRNLVPREFKLLARGGLVTPATGLELMGVTDIVGVFAFRFIKGGVVVGYNRTTRLLTVWRIDGTGGTPVLIGDWATLPAGAPLPRVTGAESYAKFFLSHAEPLFNYRAKTIYFDPSLTVGAQLVDYTADLDGMGAAVVKARGVYAWLNYLVLYGYGTASDENRPEILRISVAGEPTNLNKQHYFVVGVRDEPITAVGQAGEVLSVYKKGARYKIIGTSFLDFGILPAEQIHGCVTDRLAITVGEFSYHWSEQGPRFNAGGESRDIAIPLELDGPEPEGLATQGSEEYGWCEYEPIERLIIFGFPVLSPAGPKTRCYVLSRRQPDLFQWAYFEISQLVYSAGLIIEGAQTVGETLTAYADALVASDTGQSGTGRTVNLAWTNNALIGGETVQIFARPSGGAWSLVSSVAAAGASQDTDLTGLLGLTDYDLAIRYVKGGLATPGYSSTDPDAWDADTAADSKTTVTTTSGAPTALAGVWSRIGTSTHRIIFSFTLPELGVGFELEESPDGVGSWTQVEATAIPYDTRTLPHTTADGDLGGPKWYRLRAVKGTEFSAYTAPLEVWIGPSIEPDIIAVVQTGTTSVFRLWQRTTAGSKLEVQTSPDGATGWVTQFQSATYGLDQAVSSPISLGSSTFVRARFLVTAFSVDDAGPWSAVEEIVLTNDAVPSAPTSEDGAWSAPNAVDMTFDAPGSSLETWARYIGSSGLPEVTVEPSDAATGLSITNIRDPGASYSPFLLGATVPTENVDLIHVDVAGGKRKVSVAASVNVTMLGEGPSNLMLSQPVAGVPEIEVSWDNGAYGAQTVVLNCEDGVGPLLHYLGPPVTKAGPNDTQTGPQPGLPALSGIGTTVLVRVVHYNTSGPGRYSIPVEDTIALS